MKRMLYLYYNNKAFLLMFKMLFTYSSVEISLLRFNQHQFDIVCFEKLIDFAEEIKLK